MDQLLHVKMLTDADYEALTRMDTGIEDDYVVRIFDKLVHSEEHALFGLYEEGKMLSVAGYSLFGQKNFAMLGRLRSDRRFQKKGNATALLKPVMNHLKEREDVRWIGANTHVSNLPARRVLEKIGTHEGHVTHCLTLTTPDLLTGHTKGPVWEEIKGTAEKLALLTSMKENSLGVFPYECYYPFPFDLAFFTDQYLQESRFYISPDQSRFVIIRNDTKKYDYSHVKYFWDDHYEQPGFFETILQHWHENPSNIGCWIDFSPEGFKHIPDLRAYDVQEPWILYSLWNEPV